MKRGRLNFHEIVDVERALSSLPFPLRIERKSSKEPVLVIDVEGNFIQIISYKQLQTLLYFIQKNCELSKNLE
jgi:hypothetical protein